jgi:hypothetical protein
MEKEKEEERERAREYKGWFRKDYEEGEGGKEELKK